MALDVQQGVRNVRCAPGELTFDVDVAGRRLSVWFRTDAPVTPNADAALATCLMPAMLAGGSLAVDAPLAPRLLRNHSEIQAIERLWSRGWNYGLPPLLEVDVEAVARPAAARPAGGVATFFSGGVDSWAALTANPDVTHLVFVRGLDLAPRSPEFADAVEARLRGAAAELGRPQYVVDTNVRELSDGLLPWDVYFACPLAAVALLLAPLFERFLITGDTDYATNVGQGSDPLVDHLWGTDELEIAHVGGRRRRTERLRLIADDPVAQRDLRVCWENLDGAYNCGRCRKCLAAMIALEALGLRDRFTAFPPQLDLTPLTGVDVPNAMVLTLWQDVYDLVREQGRSDLEPPVAELIARNRRRLGLPDGFRMRDSTRTGIAAADRERLERQLASVLGSRSWRLTAPLRAGGRALRHIGHGLRRRERDGSRAPSRSA